MLSKANKAVCGAQFRNYYRKATADEKNKRLHEHVNDRIIRLFIKKVKEKIVENRSGVHIHRMGYFYVHMLPFNMMWNYKNQKVYKYQLAFVPTDNSVFKFWGMDFHFGKELNKKLQDRIKNGYRYLNMIKGVTKVDHYYLGVNHYSWQQYKRLKKNEI